MRNDKIKRLHTPIQTSHNTLVQGKWPRVDAFGEAWPEGSWRAKKAGEELALGWRATFSAWKGDCKAKCEIHRLARSYHSNWLCERCAASKVNAPTLYTNFNSNAIWRIATYTKESYLATTAPRDRTPWIQVRGFDFSRCLDDVMHILHLGVCKDLRGTEFCQVSCFRNH